MTLNLDPYCRGAVKEAKVSEKEVQSVTERSFVTTFKVSLNQLFVVLLVVVVLSESLA